MRCHALPPATPSEDSLHISLPALGCRWPIPLLELVPLPRRLIVLAVDRMAVDFRGRPHGGMAQAAARPPAAARRWPAVRRVGVAQEWRLAPFGFGIFNRLKKAETVAEIESGFSGVPSGFAKIRSRSFR